MKHTLIALLLGFSLLGFTHEAYAFSNSSCGTLCHASSGSDSDYSDYSSSSSSSSSSGGDDYFSGSSSSGGDDSGPTSDVASDSGSTGGGAIGDILCNVVGWFTGNVGKGIATLSVIVLGLGALMGKVSHGSIITVMCGIGVIFGAPGLVYNLTGQTACYSGITITITG